jgi:hypothetical protein
VPKSSIAISTPISLSRCSDRDHVLQVLHQVVFGDLEHDHAVRHAVAVTTWWMWSTRSLRSNRRLGRLTAIESAEAEALLPGLGLARRLAQRPFRQRHDEAGLLGQRDEVARRHQHAAALPAHQRLGADHARLRTSILGW